MGKGEDEMFLVGVAMSSSELGQPPKEFYSFARVGSGYSDKQLLRLLRKLKPYWRKWGKNAGKRQQPPTTVAPRLSDSSPQWAAREYERKAMHWKR